MAEAEGGAPMEVDIVFEVETETVDD